MLYQKGGSPAENLDTLSRVEYPGRFLAIGQTTTGLHVQVYAIGGRSDGSRNRVLVEEDGIVSTAPFDSTKPVGDPKLTIYDAMRRAGTTHFVTNGDQTTTAVQFARSGKPFRAAMNRRWHEPDWPNYTPRISAFTETAAADGEPGFGISVIRRNPETGGPLRKLYVEGDDGMAVEPGTALAVHTYLGNGKPLPSFNESPFTLPTSDCAADTAEMIWERLNPDTRVALAAKTIDAAGGVEIAIINHHES